jgi:hypothetical protein
MKCEESEGLEICCDSVSKGRGHRRRSDKEDVVWNLYSVAGVVRKRGIRVRMGALGDYSDMAVCDEQGRLETPKCNPGRVASRQISGFESWKGRVSGHSVYSHLGLFTSLLIPPLLLHPFLYNPPPLPSPSRLRISLQLPPRHTLLLVPSSLSLFYYSVNHSLCLCATLYSSPLFDSFIRLSVFPLVVNTLYASPHHRITMDFEHVKSPNFMDSMDPTFNYMDNSLDYLQPYSQSPTFGVPIGRMFNHLLRRTIILLIFFVYL